MVPSILTDVKNQLKNEVKILKIDVDKNPKAAQSYGIQGVPTLIIFKKGKILWRKSGVPQASELVSQIKTANSN